MRRPADWRRLGRRLLYPHPAVVALCVPAGAAGLAYVFLVAGSGGAVCALVAGLGGYLFIRAGRRPHKEDCCDAGKS